MCFILCSRSATAHLTHQLIIVSRSYTICCMIINPVYELVCFGFFQRQAGFVLSNRHIWPFSAHMPCFLWLFCNVEHRSIYWISTKGNSETISRNVKRRGEAFVCSPMLFLFDVSRFFATPKLIMTYLRGSRVTT